VIVFRRHRYQAIEYRSRVRDHRVLLEQQLQHVQPSVLGGPFHCAIVLRPHIRAVPVDQHGDERDAPVARGPSQGVVSSAPGVGSAVANQILDDADIALLGRTAQRPIRSSVGSEPFQEQRRAEVRVGVPLVVAPYAAAKEVLAGMYSRACALCFRVVGGTAPGTCLVQDERDAAGREVIKRRHISPLAPICRYPFIDIHRITTLQ